MKVQLYKVNPKHTLLFSCPCEIECANNRNETVESIANENISEVALCYLRSRSRQHQTRTMACFSGSAATFYAIVFAMVAAPAVALSALLLFGIVLPNLGNTGRYRKTKRGAKQWLKEKVGESLFKKIKPLKYNKNGIDQLASILIKEGYITNSLDKPRNKNTCCGFHI